MILLIASQVLLWALVLGLSLVVFALARQIGLLHERLAPLGALTLAGGPAVGDPAPAVAGRRLDGGTLRLDAADGRSRLLLFVSADCPLCKKLIPLARSMARAEGMELSFVGDAPEPVQRELAARHGIDAAGFVNGPELGLAFAVGKLPYAVLIDGAGRVAAKGLVNSREHLESLVTAQAMGVESLQTYLRGRAPPRPAEPALDA